MSVHVALNSLTLMQWATEEQKQRWLVPQARGEKLATFGLTEPGAGTDAAALTTTARRDGDSYVLNGSKLWISLADLADHFLVFATVDRRLRHKGVTAFLLERGMPGLTTGTIHGKLGIRAGNTGSIYLDEVRVPAREPHRRGGRGLHHRDERHRPGPVHGRVGRGRAGPGVPRRLAAIRPRAAARSAQEIGHHQLVKQMLASMGQGIEAGRLLCRQAAWLKDRGERNTRETSLAKWFCTEHAVQLRPGRHPGPRRLRLLQRVPRRALPAQQQGRRHLRGHEPAPHAHPGGLPARLPRGPTAALPAAAGAGSGARVTPQPRADDARQRSESIVVVAHPARNGYLSPS